MTLCHCVVGEPPRACALFGVCASGVETCVSGTWSGCSVHPTSEICNGLDDDCNGMPDDGLRVTCSSTTTTTASPRAGALITKRVPPARPGGRRGCRSATPTCPARLEPRLQRPVLERPPRRHRGLRRRRHADRRGLRRMIDEGLNVTCYLDVDDDHYSPMGSAAQTKCIDGTRSVVSGCPLALHERAPTTMATSDCDDTRAGSNPGAMEVCDAPGSTRTATAATTRLWVCERVPEACGGVRAPWARWRARRHAGLVLRDGPCRDARSLPETRSPATEDPDGDGYAIATASTLTFCGSCGAGYTGRIPTGADQHRLRRRRRAPRTRARPEPCNGVDNDCSGATGPARAATRRRRRPPTRRAPARVTSGYLPRRLQRRERQRPSGQTTYFGTGWAR